ncbi:hypothetical protein [Burkholderia cenocepacia]|uniref:hypothetical protein n=1 Tax=Burkholderia cenocepacia TaxID=95486 RepID=UPI000761DBBC|nr:hypothetical protein [Burkholderia cenocepacia]KWU24772.1 hypothetical protein AS149_32010 [Burkholderia cenocepacia]
MSTTLANFPNANSNVQKQPLDQSVLQAISREADFFDELKYSSKRELFSLKDKLENAVRQFAGIRTPLGDLCRMRLTQIRQHLA